MTCDPADRGAPAPWAFARVQERISSLLHEDDAFRMEFTEAARTRDEVGLTAWRDSGYASDDETGTRFLMGVLDTRDPVFHQLQYADPWDAELKDWLRQSLAHGAQTGQRQDPNPRTQDGAQAAPPSPAPVFAEPPGSPVPPRAFRIPTGTPPRFDHSRTGILRDVRSVVLPPSPQVTARHVPARKPPVAERAPGRPARRAAATPYPQHLAEPVVAGGTGPGLLGAVGTCVLGPGLATDPNTISVPYSDLARALNASDALQTYKWVAGHVLNSEWSTGDECTVLTTHANQEHKNRFEAKVRSALQYLKDCYNALRDDGFDTSAIAFGIRIHVRVSATSWAAAHPGFGDSAETQALSLYVPARLTCGASLVGRPDPTTVPGSGYARALGVLESVMAEISEVEIQNQRAADPETEAEAGRLRRKRKAVFAEEQRRVRSEARAERERVVTRFAGLVGPPHPGRPGNTAKQHLYAAYRTFPADRLAEHFSAREAAVLARYFGVQD